jgi:hypothetical protein
MLVGRANSVLLHKSLNARGTLKRSEQPAYAGDVFAIVCAETGDCEAPEAALARRRERLYYDYTWTNELWRSENLSDLKTFAIDGPMWSVDSWSRRDRPRVKPNQPIEFVAGAGSALFLDWGWSGLEDWGVWSIGSQSALSFSVDSELRKRPVRLTAQLRTVVNPTTPTIATTVEANGHELAVWQFDAQNATGSFEAILPPNVWSSDDGGVTIRFYIDKPLSPAEIGLSNDPRPLGIGLESLTVHGT